ncbi:hypothetical protein [Streptacidiphilus sp. PAMC 29251]
MRRITLWITATLAVTALLFTYQADLAGVGGKSGESKNDSGSNAPQVPGQPTSSAAPGSAAPGSSAPAKAGDNSPGDNTHSDKPGENK